MDGLYFIAYGEGVYIGAAPQQLNGIDGSQLLGKIGCSSCLWLMLSQWMGVH